MKYGQYSDDYAVSILSFNEADINISNILNTILDAINKAIAFVSKFFADKGISFNQVKNIKSRLEWLKNQGNKKISVTQEFIEIGQPNIADLRKHINSKLECIKTYASDNNNVSDQNYWNNKVTDYNKRTSLKQEKLQSYINSKLGISVSTGENGETVYAKKTYKFSSTTDALNFCNEKIGILDEATKMMGEIANELNSLRTGISSQNTENGAAKVTAMNSIITNTISTLSTITRSIINIMNVFHKEFTSLVSQIADEISELAANPNTENPQPINASFQFTKNSEMGCFGQLNFV